MSNYQQLTLFSANDELPAPPLLNLLDKPRSLEDFQNSFYSPHSNPHLDEFIRANLSNSQADKLNPLPEDLVAGKNSYVYDAHTYHTKVPPQAITRLIEHYTRPGELILDPFCGSGMTGVAAVNVGRKPVLIDLSPAATFIALNFLTPVNHHIYFETIEKVLAATGDEQLALYGTHCRKCNSLVPMEYMVWSYGLMCEFCRQEFLLWDVARDERENVRESKIKTEFDCPHCSRHLEKRKLQRTTAYPVQVGYRCCEVKQKETTAPPDEYDLRLIQSLDQTGVPAELWYPTAKFPFGVNTRQAIGHGFTSVDALYTTRALHTVARLWDIARRWPDQEISLALMFTVTSLYQRVTRLSEFRFWGGSSNIANYNVPMIFNEQNVFKVYYRKAKTIQSHLATWEGQPNTPFCVSTQSATDLRPIPSNSIDYIFTDPPFGSNINYSEMNYLWEAWLGVFTQTESEAIINRVQSKSLKDYRLLMAKAFGEMHRVLKPGRWLTVMFHNSSAKVWSALQAALAESGFEVEQTQSLDKQHGTFKQFVSKNAVGYDLLLHCQKKADHRLNIQGIQRKSTSYKTISEFVERTLKQKPDEFVVRYLHVKRKDEMDTRKLYSMWLKEHLEAGEMVNLDYEEFRKILDQVIALEFDHSFVSETE
jgi:DNA modification methylase